MELERSMWNSKTYYYLSEEDSALYDRVKDSQELRDIEIARLIMEKAEACYTAHCESTY